MVADVKWTDKMLKMVFDLEVSPSRITEADTQTTG
jgi:hypothetical protein